MRPDLQFDFVADKDKNTLTITREFDAEHQMVWDCYTKSELLNRWFAPKPFTTKTKSMDFREGGHWHYAMVDPEGTEHWCRQDYETINATEGYTAFDGFSDETGAINPNLPRAHLNAQFKEKAARTVVHTVVQYKSLADLETVIQMRMEEGLKSTLERLDELLVTLKK